MPNLDGMNTLRVPWLLSRSCSLKLRSCVFPGLMPEWKWRGMNFVELIAEIFKHTARSAGRTSDRALSKKVFRKSWVQMVLCEW